MEPNYIAVVVVLLCGLGTVFGEICYDYGTYNRYCANGCCGSSYNQYCCDDIVDIGALVGGVIGGLIILSIIIAVVCVVCQKKQRPGRVVHPGGGGATVIMSHPQGYATAPQQYPSAYPPGYGGNHAYPPPVTSGGNPAYPPPYPGNHNNAPPPPAQY